MGMRFALFCMMLPALLLTACKKIEDDGGRSTDTQLAEPTGSYEIDRESGEIRATHTDAAGVTTRLQAGENVAARFPAPFTAYPGSTITNTVLLDRGEAGSITVEFTTPDPRGDVVRFYREQAREAGIAPDVEVSAGDTTTLAGEDAGSRTRFALQVTETSGPAEAHVTISRGLD